MGHRATKAFGAILVLMLVVSCTKEVTHSHIEGIQDKGKLVMLCFPTLGGGVSPNLERGTTRRVGTAEDFVGLEVSLMEEFSESLGVDLEIRTLEEPGYAPLIPAMLRGGADLVASTLSVTEERETIVDFSEPYDFVYKVVVTQTGSGISVVEDLAGKIAVTSRGSSHYQHLSAMGILDEDMVFVDFVEEYYPVLAAGAADYAVVDSFYSDRLDEFQNVHGVEGLAVAFAFPDRDRIAIAVPQGSDLKPALDQFLAELESRGRLERLRQAARSARGEM